jgi:hypothetical protein
MPAPDLRTLAGASVVMEEVMFLAKINMENDGALQPVAFIFTTFDPVRRRTHAPDILTVGVHGGHFTDADSKAKFDQELRRLVKATRAIGVGMIAEAWTVAGAQLAPDQQTHAEAHGLGDHPDRAEIARCTLEHVEGNRQWTAPVIRSLSDPDHPTLGKFVEDHVTGTYGRFANLLTDTRPTAKA